MVLALFMVLTVSSTAKRLDATGAAKILRLSPLQLELLEKDARAARETWEAL